MLKGKVVNHPKGVGRSKGKGKLSLLKFSCFLLPLVFLFVYSVNTTYENDALATMKESFSSFVMGREEDMVLTIPSTVIRRDDDYWCTALPVRGLQQSIKSFVPLANASLVHHMFIHTCSERPVPEHGVKVTTREGNTIVAWPCKHNEEGTCPGTSQNLKSRLLYAWANGAEEFDSDFPRQGFVIGSRRGIDAPYLVLQNHFLRAPTEAEEARKDAGGIQINLDPMMPERVLSTNIFLNANFMLAPRRRKIDVKVKTCVPGSGFLDLYAYRVHAHAFGRNVSLAIAEEGGKMVTLLSGNPQLPHFFNKVKGANDDDHGDGGVLRLHTGKDWEVTCTYDTTASDHEVVVGADHGQEMCNMYLMFASNQPSERTFVGGLDDGSFIVATSPVDEIRSAYKMGGITHKVEVPSEMAGEKGGGGSGRSRFNPLNFLRKFYSSKGTARPQAVFFDEDLGQVGGVHLGFGGNPNHMLVFHRALRMMEVGDHANPIGRDIFQLWDVKEKRKVESFGKDLGMKLPHGLTVDRDTNLWLTDVDTQLAYKLDPSGRNVLLTVGVEGVRQGAANGFDPEYLCRPTEVVVSNSGDFFVTDGYCNSRVVRYDRTGRYLAEFNLTYGGEVAQVPHSIVLDDCADVLVVADRENALIHFVDATSGAPRRNPLDLSGVGKVYSVTRDEYGGIYALCWKRDAVKAERKTYLVRIEPEYEEGDGAKMDATVVELVNSLYPHDFAVSYNFFDHALDVYVGETGTARSPERGRVVRYRLRL
ncbi:peptidylglycine alpha-amidating monooxygenase [Chloropicon primus]|uniref:Peptidylglycine alpha-amidating monooxygenase n=1 Tax=Chloropicon primus TaxID=1764295 RepID=A0A5B8N1V0_9CHLO|nr:peptidylglycine alpha-amidating monooxygenase [Chloropicon primus]|eukprot:QDZ25820.1 peptidylglycine alpha-amidating monooxygenase [Chloropicon primus]